MSVTTVFCLWRMDGSVGERDEVRFYWNGSIKLKELYGSCSGESTHTQSRAGIKAQRLGAGFKVGCKVACQTHVSILKKLKYHLLYEIWYWMVIVLYHAAAKSLLLSSHLLGLWVKLSFWTFSFFTCKTLSYTLKHIYTNSQSTNNN